MQEVRNFVRKTIDAFNRKDGDAVCSLIVLGEGEPNLQQLQSALYNVRNRSGCLLTTRLDMECVVIEQWAVNYHLQVTTTHGRLDDRRLNTRNSTEGDQGRIAASQGSNLQLFGIHHRVLSEQVCNGRCL